jgi:hypothetical protein
MRANLKSAVRDCTKAIFDASSNNKYKWDHIFPKDAFNYVHTIIVLNKVYGIITVSGKDIYIFNITRGTASVSSFPQGLSTEDLEEIDDLPILYL